MDRDGIVRQWRRGGVCVSPTAIVIITAVATAAIPQIDQLGREREEYMVRGFIRRIVCMVYGV